MFIVPVVRVPLVEHDLEKCAKFLACKVNLSFFLSVGQARGKAGFIHLG